MTAERIAKVRQELERLSGPDKPAHLRRYVGTLRAQHPEVFEAPSVQRGPRMTRVQRADYLRRLAREMGVRAK